MKKCLSVFLAVVMLAGLGLFGVVPAGAEEATGYEPPANLNELSPAEQLAYFNLVVNRVRAEQPGFKQTSLLEIDNIASSDSSGLAKTVLDLVRDMRMPGELESQKIAAGVSNEGLFFSKNANASDLRLEDITGISCEKNGDYWVIELGIAAETNPAPGLESAHGRITPIATREQVIEEIEGAINDTTVAPEDLTLHYYYGFARVTVNGKGQVIAGSNGFRVHAQANNMKIVMIRTGVAVEQSSNWYYNDFKWTQPFLVRLWNFILKWFFFGWTWMK